MFKRQPATLPQSRFHRKRVFFGVNLGFAIILVVLLANLANLYKNTRLFDENQQRANDFTRFTVVLEQLTSAIHSAESAQKNYVSSRDRYFLDQFQSAAEQTEYHMRRLEKLIPELEPFPSLTLDFLNQAANRLELLHRGIRILHRDGREAAQAFAADEMGQQIRAGFEAALTQVRSPTFAMMEDSVNKVQHDQMMANASFFAAGVLNLLLVITGFILVRRYLGRQVYENWLKSGEAELNSAMLSKQNLADFASSTLSLLASYLNAQRGVFYLCHNNHLIKAGSLAAGPVGNHPNSVPLQFEDFPHLAMESTFAGECVRQKRVIHITEIESASNKHKIEAINMGIGEWLPREILLFPILFDTEVIAVVELASLSCFTEAHRNFIQAIQNDIARSLENVIRRVEIHSLLIDKTKRAEELQLQQEELRASNEELEDQTRALNEAKKRLQLQQEELEQTNIELEQQANILEDQKEALKNRNEDLLRAKEEIERKAREVEQGSRFKSEFLANMSHELRTPLNSILIMSTLLSENQNNTLGEKEVEYAKTINKAGSDLLNLINDILDLSKVEAGQLKVHLEAESLLAITEGIKKIFQPVAEEKNLNFTVHMEPDLNPNIVSDRQRLEQIINNFLSNAFKFTEKGSVTLTIESLQQKDILDQLNLAPGSEAISFHVRDTGIGIDSKDLAEIFDAFKQVDGSIRRRHGGTGLGLAISRQLASMLQGMISVESELDKGSCFSLHIPREISVRDTAKQTDEAMQTDKLLSLNTINILAAEEKRIYKFREVLIVEDDQAFADTVANVAEEFRLRTYIIHDGQSALEYLRYYIPEAIVLDINLPSIDGLSILNAIKHDAELKKIPIHVISGYDFKHKALALGAESYQYKPVSICEVRNAFSKLESSLAETHKRILLVEDQPVQRENVVHLLSSEYNISIDQAANGEEAIERLCSEVYDCIILDLNLPDFSGFELLDFIETGEIAASERPPIIIYTAKDLSIQEQERLKGRFNNVIVKGGRSAERLLDEVELFLHQIGGNNTPTSPARRTIINKVQEKFLNNDEKIFSNREVLVVDDDMRNVFALASVLENKGMAVTIARNGKEALEILKTRTNRNIEIVLMDIMMPVMDGYETVKAIRAIPEYQDLPIIALTAKAMKGDQERCLQVGATDYLAKPIELSQLFSLLRVWLSRDYTQSFIHSERV